MEELNILSGHRPLSLFLNSVMDITNSNSNSSSILKHSKDRQGKQMYNPNFEEMLNSNEIKTIIKDLTAIVQNKDGKNTINHITEVENLLVKVSDLTNLKKTPGKHTMAHKKYNNYKEKRNTTTRNPGTTFNVEN